MSNKPELPLSMAIEYLLHDVARTLSLAPWRAHRVFHADTSEPLPKRLARVHALYQRSKLSDSDHMSTRFARLVDEALGQDASPVLRDAFRAMTIDLAEQNRLLFSVPADLDFRNVTSTELRELTDILIDREYLINNDERVLQHFCYGAALVALGLTQAHFPRLRSASPHAPQVPIISLVADPATCIQQLLGTFLSALNPDADEAPARTFSYTRSCLWQNLLNASHVTEEQARQAPYKLVFPEGAKLAPAELVETYLGGTPLADVLMLPVPFAIPPDTYKEHGFLFARSGHGKSQTLRTLFASLLAEDCALILIDGNGALIDGIDRIASIKDRLIVLDPNDKPALNFFKLHGGSREKQHELFFYLFKAINQELTERQATMVSYLVDFMQAIPGATLDTLREVCEAKELPYQEHLPRLSPLAQNFFSNQFCSRDALVQQTKTQIAQRIYTVGRNQKFVAMFDATENNFDPFKAIQEKRIVVVDTSRHQLGDHGSAIFGRFILAQCLNAAFQRPKDKRHLALIICDEAKAYLDDQSQKILSDARQYGLGLLLATQFPDQLEDGVRKEVINNTAIKFAGPAAFSVVAQMNRDMRCEAEFILNMKKQDYAHAEWACYVGNVTPHALKLTIPFGTIEKLPQLTAAEHAALRRENRERLAASPADIKPVNSQEAHAAPSLPASDIELVIIVARRLETLLETHYGALGRGLHEKIAFVEDKLPPHLPHRGHYVATMRNKVLHAHDFTLPDREWFLKCAKEFEDHFSKNSPQQSSVTAQSKETLEYDTDI